MISVNEIEKALDYLRDNAEIAAQAAANEVYMVEYRKTLKAKLMKECNSKIVGEREMYAYAHSDYETHILGLKEAVYQARYHRFMRETANAKIEAWRTQEANMRTAAKI